MLDKYLTSVYYKKGSLTSLLSFFLRGELKRRARNRKITALKDEDVVQIGEFEGLLQILSGRWLPMRSMYDHIKYGRADRFAVKACRYIERSNAKAVITYDDTSSLMFEKLSEVRPKVARILDVSSAGAAFMNLIYCSDINKSPKYAGMLKEEAPFVFERKLIERNNREIRAAQYYLAPSDFVRKSLVYAGAEDSHIFTLPYGVDISAFSCKSYQSAEEMERRPLRFIYVGGMKERKGISYLLRAFSTIPRGKAVLTIVGAVDENRPELKVFSGVYEPTGLLMHNEIPAELQKADVFVFPSLSEGLSLSVLEGAACGLPLIVSENSGANDCMTEGEEGFVIPIQSDEAIKEKVLWFCNHRDMIPIMGKKARTMAEKYSWDNYYKNLSDIIQKILEMEEESNGDRRE